MAESSAVSAHVIYDALVEYAGAPDNEFWRQTFVDCTNWLRRAVRSLCRPRKEGGVTV